MTQRASGTDMRPAWRWDIVWLGRLAGAFVIASAVGLAIWIFVQAGDYASMDNRVLAMWNEFVSIAWGGAAIILLAELVSRLAGRQPGNSD